MNIYNKSSLIDFYRKHADSKIPLQMWNAEVQNRRWKSPNEIKKEFGGSVSILKNSRVAFDIKGNSYQLVAAVNYEKGWLFIKFIGTHKEYDNIDANNVEFSKK